MRAFSVWLKVPGFLLQENVNRENFDIIFSAKYSTIGFEVL